MESKIQTEFPELQENIEVARRSLNEAYEPWQEKIHALEAKRDEAVKPAKAAVKAAEDAFAGAREKAFNTRRKEVFDATLKAVPDVETFAWFAIWAKQHYNNSFNDFHCYGDEPVEIRCPKVPGLTLLGIAEDNKPGSTKFYGAWRNGVLVGLLSIDPAKHPGDATDAYGEVGGEPTKFEGPHSWDVKRPFKTWIAHLRTVSEQ